MRLISFNNDTYLKMPYKNRAHKYEKPEDETHTNGLHLHDDETKSLWCRLRQFYRDIVEEGVPQRFHRLLDNIHKNEDDGKGD